MPAKAGMIQTRSFSTGCYVDDISDTVAGTSLYYYGYDQVGNVVYISKDDGSWAPKQFVFHQDAFGNEVDTGAFSSNSWSAARGRDYRITEHQTGKDYDPEVWRWQSVWLELT